MATAERWQARRHYRLGQQSLVGRSFQRSSVLLQRRSIAAIGSHQCYQQLCTEQWQLELHGHRHRWCTLWVVNDTTTTDKVFRYTTAGALEGSWSISTTNPSPSGITLDPTNVNHLWIVDPSTDRIYQYDAGTARLTGAQEPSVSYALATTNTNPQGIADPLVVSAAFAAPSIASGAISSGTNPVANRVTRDEVVDNTVAELSQMPIAGMTDDAAVLACSAWGTQPSDAQSDGSSPLVETEDVIDQLFADLDSLL